MFEDKFVLEYLSIFDKYFIPVIRQIAVNSSTGLFQSLVQTLIDSGSLQHYPVYLEKIERLQYSYELIKYTAINQEQIQQQIQKLKELFTPVRTHKQLEECQSIISSIGDIILLSLDEYKFQEPTLQEKIEALKVKIQEEIETLKLENIFVFKFNHLVDLVFDLGAYCLFKGKFEEIYYLWNYKQPPDSDATWLGHDIVPHALVDLITLYFSSSPIERGIPMYWEDHHGSRSYYDQYFLLLLLREFLRIQVYSDQPCTELISKFQLPASLNSNCLNAISYQVDELLVLARELKNKLKMLQQLGFQKQQSREVIENGLIPFLESLKPKAKSQILQMVRAQSISPTKVEAFKAKFIAEYTQKVILKFLFQYYGLYENKQSDQNNEVTPTLCDDRVLEKYSFFDHWYISSNTSDYGKYFAIKEDTQLINELKKHCTRIEGATVESVLKIFSNSDLESLIIVTVNILMPYFFNRSAQFHPKGDESSLNLDIAGFAGSYTYAGHKIPVFETFISKSDDNALPEKFIIILNRNKLGCLKQYSLIENQEPSQSSQNLKINIRAFSEHPNLINDMLKSSPEWLLNKGNIANQIAFLETKMFMQACQKFELSIATNFIGYLIPT